MECIASCSSRAKARTCGCCRPRRSSPCRASCRRARTRTTAVVSCANGVGARDRIGEEARAPPPRRTSRRRVGARDDEVAQHDEERRPRLRLAGSCSSSMTLRLDAQQQRVRVARDERPLADHPVELVVVALERRERVVGPVHVEAGDDRVACACGRDPVPTLSTGHHLRTARRVRAAVLLHRRRQLAPVRDAQPVDLRDGPACRVIGFARSR